MFDGATNAGATLVDELSPSTHIVVVGKLAGSDGFLVDSDDSSMIDLVAAAKADGHVVWTDDGFHAAVGAAEASLYGNGSHHFGPLPTVISRCFRAVPPPFHSPGQPPTRARHVMQPTSASVRIGRWFMHIGRWFMHVMAIRWFMGGGSCM